MRGYVRDIERDAVENEFFRQVLYTARNCQHTLYSPPNHRDGVIHEDRAAAERDDEHFDGRTTESSSS